MIGSVNSEFYCRETNKKYFMASLLDSEYQDISGDGGVLKLTTRAAVTKVVQQTNPEFEKWYVFIVFVGHQNLINLLTTHLYFCSLFVISISIKRSNTNTAFIC